MMSGYKFKERAAILLDDVNLMTLADPKLLANTRIVLTRTSHPGNIGAAARAMKGQIQGQRVGVLISGGNVDLARFCQLLGGTPA